MPEPARAAATLVRNSIAVLFERDAAVIGEAATLDELGLDSLDRAELALTLEAAVGVRYTDQDFVAVRTVADLIALTRRKMVVAESGAEV